MEIVVPEPKNPIIIPKKDTRLLNWMCLECEEGNGYTPSTSTSVESCPFPDKDAPPIDLFEANRIHPVLHMHRNNNKIYYYAYNRMREYDLIHSLPENQWLNFRVHMPQINLKPSDWHICPEEKLDKLLFSFTRYAGRDSIYTVTFSFGERSTYADFVENYDWMNIIKARRYMVRDLSQAEKESLPVRGI